MADKDRNSRNIGIIAFMISLPAMIYVAANFVEPFFCGLGAPRFLAGGIALGMGLLVVGWVTLTDRKIV